MRYNYYKSLEGNLLIRDNDADNSEEYILERFDPDKNRWVDDSDMCGIFSGDILTKVITEAEVEKVIHGLK